MTQLRWDRAEYGGGVPEPGGPHPGGTAADVGPPSDGLPPLRDPYLDPALAPPRAQLSRLALTSVIAAFIGPVGAICAIVFGWIARREIDSGTRRTGRGLATAGVVLGIAMTIAWGAGIGGFIWWRHGAASAPIAAEPAKPPEPPGDKADPAPAPTPSDTPSSGTVPNSTTLQKVGGVTLVDVGVNVTTLQEELAKQRAEAMTAGETVLVMTVKDGCVPCRDVGKSLADPLVQTALTKVRLVRVDIDAFRDDLEALKIPTKDLPYYVLLALDLTPKDAIHGGEWDEDIPQNIAPVLGAFVRGKYTTRRHQWRRQSGSGVRL